MKDGNGKHTKNKTFAVETGLDENKKTHLNFYHYRSGTEAGGA